MGPFELFSLLLTVTSGLAVLNQRFLRWPESIGVLGLSLLASIIIAAVSTLFPGFLEVPCAVIQSIDFSYLVLNVLLGFLMFAGAFSSHPATLARERVPILIYATLGMLLSTALVGILFFTLMKIFGLPVPFLHALLFGALISPTDPVAVLAILRKVGAPPQVETDIAGESLLNDGVAVVVFMTLLGLAEGGHGAEGSTGLSSVVGLFAQEVAGGVGFGWLVGFLAWKALRTSNGDHRDLLITLALATGGYTLAQALHLSGPLAMVTAGLYLTAKRTTQHHGHDHLHTFWQAIEEILNALLFVAMGLVIVVLTGHPFLWVAGLVAIPLVLVCRLASVSAFLPLVRWTVPKSTAAALLTWGGLRGGISMALALSIPQDLSRETLIHATYVVVVFSILVQGLTMKRVVQRVARPCITCPS